MGKRNKILIIIFLICFILQPFILKEVKAAELEKNIIILIDNSGSMKITDPHRLAVVAGAMLIDTVDENTNLNVIAFGDKPDFVQKLADRPSKEKLKSKLSGLMFDNSRTNLKEGLKEALGQFENVQGERTIIVLSDGKEDPVGGVTEEHMKELFSLGDKAHDMRVMVHCIGLSEYADEDTLTKLSSKTGGDYFYSENPSGIFAALNKILGSLNNFYTIEQFTTNSNTDKEIKLSSYVDEVVIKIASCDNTVPLVDVAFEEGITPDYKIGDKYKIYNFKNIKSSTIRITSKDKESNFVIVQVKSKVQLNINSSSDNLSIPFKVPMDIKVNFQAEENIKGLHMDKLEDGIRERISSTDNEFKFTFKKEVPGNYPILITAYDGNGNIVAVRDINITVKDYPPFYYTKSLPSTIITENSFKVEIKQQDDSKVNNPSGEIYIEYGDKYEKIPLKFEGGMLTADINLKNSGEIKISSRIDVIRDNKTYSYYLPYFNSKVLEKPFVELSSESYAKPFKQNEQVNLRLSINKNSIYGEEDFFILNSKNEKIGEFKLNKDSKGRIEVALKPLGKGENFEFFIRPRNEKGVKVTSKISTNIRVVSDGSYFISKNRRIITCIVIFLLLVALVIATGFAGYKIYVRSCKINKEVSFVISSNANIHTKGIYVDIDNPCTYINLINDRIIVDSTENNAIGSFELKAYRGFKIVQGLSFLLHKYILRKDEVFKLWYKPIVRHVNSYSEEISDIPYLEGEKLKVKLGQKEIKINFL